MLKRQRNTTYLNSQKNLTHRMRHTSKQIRKSTGMISTSRNLKSGNTFQSKGRKFNSPSTFIKHNDRRSFQKTRVVQPYNSTDLRGKRFSSETRIKFSQENLFSQAAKNSRKIQSGINYASPQTRQKGRSPRVSFFGLRESGLNTSPCQGQHKRYLSSDREFIRVDKENCPPRVVQMKLGQRKFDKCDKGLNFLGRTSIASQYSNAISSRPQAARRIEIAKKPEKKGDVLKEVKLSAFNSMISGMQDESEISFTNRNSLPPMENFFSNQNRFSRLSNISTSQEMNRNTGVISQNHLSSENLLLTNNHESDIGKRNLKKFLRQTGSFFPKNGGIETESNTEGNFLVRNNAIRQTYSNFLNFFSIFFFKIF